MTVVPVYGPETPVKVSDLWPEQDGPVHIRTPHYLRGVPGRIIRCLGAFPNPEDLAFARQAPVIPLYHVAFEAAAIWPAAEPHDLLVEIFEHWLEPLTMSPVA